MIRKQTETDLTAIMQIWLETNTKAHSFIPEEYWLSNYEMVKRNGYQNRCGEESISARAVRTKKIV